MSATRCRRCRDGELPVITRFAAGVFGVDFPNYLPRLYRPGAATERNHFAVYEDGEPAAAVVNFPLALTVGAANLATFGVGTVCVGEKSRGKGYMTDLMTECLCEAAGRGAALSLLSGQRQRYGYFGYSLIGENVTFTVTSQSVRHTVGEDCRPYAVREAVQADAPSLVRMMETRPVYSRRTEEDFIIVTSTDYRHTYIVSDGEDDVGYFVAKADLRTVTEAVLLPGAEADRLVTALVGASGGEFSVIVPSHETELFTRMHVVCDRWSAAPAANVCVLDFPAVISAFGELLLRRRAVPDSRLVLGVEEHPFLGQIGVSERGRTHGNFGISVENGRLGVRPVDEAADIVLPYPDALELLFGRTGEVAAYLPPLARALFPLPFFFPKADMV